MIDDKPFDFVLLGFLIGCYNIGDYNVHPIIDGMDPFDIDAAYHKLGKMGFIGIAERVAVENDFDRADVMDWLSQALMERSLNVPFSSSVVLDQGLQRKPIDFLTLGFMVSALDDGSVGVDVARSLLCDQLDGMGMSTVKTKVINEIDKESCHILDWIENDLNRMSLNVSLSSSENLRSIDIISMMKPGVWSSLPDDVHGELKDAERHINNADYIAASRSLGPAVEFAYRALYRQLCPSIVSSEPSTYDIGRDLEERSRSDRQHYRQLTSAVSYVRSFMNDHRNPNTHQRRSLDGWDMRGLLNDSIGAITRISNAMEKYRS